MLAAHLAAEVAEVLGVLADLHLLDDLTETRTIASSVLANNAHLLRALRLEAGEKVCQVLTMTAKAQACSTQYQACMTLWRAQSARHIRPRVSRRYTATAIAGSRMHRSPSWQSSGGQRDVMALAVQF